MEYNLQTLADMINRLDTYYEFSDNPKRVIKGTDQESDIAHWLHGLDNSETNEVLTLLNKVGQFNYIRYFQNK